MKVLYACEDCGKECETIPKLKQHRRYYCHSEESLTCRWCDRDFPTKTSLSQHCRHAHRSEWDAEVEKSDNRKQSRFSTLEIYHIITAEMEYTGRNILQHRAERFRQDGTTLTTLRRSKRYCLKMERIRADIEEAVADPLSTPPLQQSSCIKPFPMRRVQKCSPRGRRMTILPSPHLTHRV